MLNRKVKKLIRDPKLFFSDMVKKQKKKINSIQPKEYNGNYQYTVVTAVYNVGRYLDEYFNSMVKQRLDFKKHINLILVDDGSTDESAEIIKSWKKKYPKNITYLYKSNGGQASARNMGLQYVNTDWVTFIDPDDFLDVNYFKAVDSFAKTNEKKKLDLVSCNFIFYFDEVKLYKDTHPLKYRYSQGDKLFAANNLGNQLQLSASTAFFKTNVILDNKINFDSRVKPSFEDAHFVAQYLIHCKESNIGFLKSAKYFYRKRGDGTSTLDSAWEHPGLYDSVLEHGCLDILKKHRDLTSEIPKNVQITILYHLIWYIKSIVNHPQKIAFLTEEQQVRFISLVKEIFSYIDTQTIMEFGLGGCWFYHRVGLLSQFKNERPPFQIIYIESYDHNKGLIELRYFTGTNELEHISENNNDIIPYFAKTMVHTLTSETFVKERRIWVPISEKSKFNVKISDIPTRISFQGKQYKSGIDTNIIVKGFLGQIPKYNKVNEFKKSWLLMDRDGQADDNAEHLYNYIQKHHPEQSIYFALRRNSHDWDRLLDKGFNLVEFGSKRHEEILKSCSKVISSHVDKYITNLLGPKMLTGRHFVFLQHGVTKDDISNWVNQKENIDVFVTASTAEYNSIVSNESHYKFTKKNVKLTGFPRYDNLNQPQSELYKKSILIMPTWRSNIVGTTKGEGNSREVSSEFMETEFAKHWRGVLHSPYLKRISEKYNFEVIFFPHANISPYIDLFDVPNFIKISDHTKGSIQNLFKSSSMMITDYSSVAFDMAIQGKQTLYYQFDEKEVFSGGHFYKKGYFDYREDGFGPVVVKESEFFYELEKIIKDDASPAPKYQSRIDKTFPIRDTNNCKRTYEAICELDNPLVDRYCDLEILEDYARKATSHRKWGIAISRWKMLLEFGNSQQKQIARLRLIQACREDGKINDAINLLQQWSGVEHSTYFNEYNIEYARIYMACQQWGQAIAIWNSVEIDNTEDEINYYRCLAEIENTQALDNLNVNKDSFSDTQRTIIMAYQLVAHKDWEAAIELILEKINTFNQNELHVLKSELILARCYREIGNSEQCHNYLKSYEVYAKKDTELKYEIGKLSFDTCKWSKVISQFDSADIKLNLLSNDLALIYVRSLRYQGHSSKALSFLDEMQSDTLQLIDYRIEVGENYLLEKEWNSAAEVWIELIGITDSAPYRLALAYRKLGMIEEGLSVLFTDGIRSPKELEEWMLRAELSQLSGNWSEAKHCWSSILRYYSDIAPQESWSRLNHAQLMSAIYSTQKLENTM